MVKVAYTVYATFFLPRRHPHGFTHAYTSQPETFTSVYKEKSRPLGRLSRRNFPSYHYNALLWLLELEIILTVRCFSQACTRLRLARGLC